MASLAENTVAYGGGFLSRFGSRHPGPESVWVRCTAARQLAVRKLSGKSVNHLGSVTLFLAGLADKVSSS